MVCFLPDHHENSVADAYGLEAEQLKDDDYRHVIASMLRVADFGIQSLQMRDAEPAPSQRNDIFTNIEAIHTVQDTEGNTSSYALNMAEESDGTNSYFKLIGVVKRCWMKERFLSLTRWTLICILF